MNRVQGAGNQRREVVAITGKGGAGKTTFTAILAKILAADGVNLLAVDADPPVSLTYALGAQLLRFGIESLTEQHEVTVIDCEAGIEQVNRRVIDSISKLIMISDATLKGGQPCQLKVDRTNRSLLLPHFAPGNRPRSSTA